MKKYLICFLVGMAGIINIQFSRASTNLVLDNFYNANQNNDWLAPASGEKLCYELMLPRDFNSTSHAKMPIFIVLDQQNTSNYKHTVQTIDFLTSLSSLPSSGIIGVGFNDGMQRHQLSRYNNSQANLENLMLDLVSLIKNEVNTHEINLSNIIVIGHSRTGYIAMQFMFNYPSLVAAVIAGSAQSITSDKEEMIFDDFLTEINNSNSKHQLYYSSGEEVMGDGDEQQTKALIKFFKAYKNEGNFCATGEILKCDHYNSLGIIVNQNLTRLFDGYNRALQECFDKINSKEIAIYDQVSFSAIYDRISAETGIDIEQDISFYISMFYAYFNDYKGNFGNKKVDYATAVLKDGMERFPKDFRLIYHYLYLLLETGKMVEAEKFFAENSKLFDSFVWANEQMLEEELKQVDLLFQAYR